MPRAARISESAIDAMFLSQFRQNPKFEALFFNLVTGRSSTCEPEALGQRRHVGATGSIDIVLRYPKGPMLLIENKIDAAYSMTREGHGQPQRYQKTVAAYRELGHEALSVLVAPERYLRGSALASLFDRRISYESLRGVIEGEDLVLLEAAIVQAETPYEPVANTGAMDFFSGVRQLVSERYPALLLNPDPNSDGVRPEYSRTIYFDVSKTLNVHLGLGRVTMSLQCWDSDHPSASVKIMLGGLARLSRSLSAPQTLKDIGGYLRPASGSLGIVIDTPRLENQLSVEDQLDELVEALEAAMRLQTWWNRSEMILRDWTQPR